MISTTQPTSTSAIVGSPSSGAAATETQADSNPARAGLVPSIGSTTSTQRGSPPGFDHAAVLGVEGDVGGVLGQVALHPRLRPLVDRERHVAAGAVAGVRAALVATELGQHDLAQVGGELGDQPADRMGVGLIEDSGRAPSVTSTSISLPSRMMVRVTFSPGS